MAITNYVDFVNNYLTKNGMIGNAANINKAPDQLKLEVDELNQSIGSLNNTSVKLTGNQTIGGTKTFSSNIVGSITGNAGTVTKLQTARTINGVPFDGSANIIVSDSTAVKLTGNQTVAGVKTFSSSPIVPTPTTDTQATNKQYVDGKYSGFKNYIINGNFDIWQRGNSQTSSKYGSDDRWFNHHNAPTVNKTHSRITCTDTERALFNATYFSRTVVTSVAGAGYYISKLQRIEDVTRLAGKTVTLSFWARADANKNIAFDFSQLFGVGGSPSETIHAIEVQKVALTTSWQKITRTVTLPSIIGKTLGEVNTTMTQIEFFFEAGSNLNLRTASLGQQSGTFDIAQVQLEEGSVATPFENRPIGLELSLCQRYYRTNATEAGLFRTSNEFVCSNIYFNSMRGHPTVSIINGVNSIHDPVAVAFKSFTGINTTGSYLNLIGTSASAINNGGQLIAGALAMSSEL